jgi:hypothetical protein
VVEGAGGTYVLVAMPTRQHAQGERHYHGQQCPNNDANHGK